MDLQSTLLKGVVRSSEDGLFYLFPIQSLSTLQEMKGHLTCAIDVLSNPDESDVEKRLDAVRTLNSLVAALSVNDGDHYDVICALYAFVVATAISGPAQVYITLSASLAMELPTTFTIPRVLTPRSFAIRSAARESAVSPD